MVASCYRRMGAYQQALKLYEDIHKSHPNDVECVRYLITICKEMKLKYDHYAVHLRKLEKMQEQQQQQQSQKGMGTVSGVMEGGTGFGGEDDGLLPRKAAVSPDGEGFGGGMGGLGDDGMEGSKQAKLYEAADVSAAQKGPKRRLASTTKDKDDDDDWGDDELGDDLLPL